MPDAARAYPYEGSGTRMVIVDDPEDTGLLSEVFSRMFEELPTPKKKN